MFLLLKPISSGASIVADASDPTCPGWVRGKWVPAGRPVCWDVRGSIYNPHFWQMDLPYRLTIALIHYEDVENLRRCLSAIDRQTAPKESYEVIVADDGTLPPSGYRLRELIREYHSRMNVDLVINPRTEEQRHVVRNCSVVSNMALARAHGVLWLRHSSHIIPCNPECLRHLYDSYGNVRTCGVMNDLPEGAPEAPPEQLFSPENRATRAFASDLLVPEVGGESDRPEYYRGPGTIPLESVLRVGGYSQCFTGWGGEDDVLSILLERDGCYEGPRRFAAQYVHLWHPPRKQDDAVRSMDLFKRLQPVLKKRAIHHLPEKFYTD